jgi:hypothetical protein
VSDDYELWLSRLRNVKRSSDGNSAEASCPLPGHEHGDRRRSLTIARGRDRAVVMHCHKETAGHTFEQLRDWLGLRPGRDHYEATYDYVDENGVLLSQVVRKPGKKFTQRRPDGAGGWVWKLGDTRRVLYRLPEVIEAVHAGRPIYVLEGEKDVHALEAAGHVATCNPGGAGKWRAEYAQALAGAHVVVGQDRDEAGRDHAGEVVESLLDVAATVKLVEPAEGKDAADHLAAGHTVGEFVEVAFTPTTFAERWAAAGRNGRAPGVVAAGATSPPLGDDTSVGRIRRVLFEDTESTRDGGATVREPVPGTGGLFWRGVAHSLFGDRGEGKSVVTVTATVAAAAAGEHVLYLDRENGRSLLRSLVVGVLEAHEDWPDVLASGAWMGRHYPAFDAMWEPADYAEAIAGHGYTGVVYDSVREVISELGGDPNAEADYSTLQRVLVTPLLRRGVWVVLLDNVGHVEKGRPKGSGAKLDAVPIAYQVHTAQEFGPTTEGAVEVKCTRSRYGDVGREWGVRVGGGRFDVPEPREESPDQRAAREVGQRREHFIADVRAELTKDAPLGRKELLKRVKGARTETKREWLAEATADPASGIVHDERSGYSLRTPSEGGPQVGARAPLKGRGTPGPPTAGTPPTADDLLARAGGHDFGNWTPPTRGEPDDREDWRNR